MGTLGCVNDMLQRDKENRALRKIGRERMKETRRRLLEISASSSSSHPSLEHLEDIRKNTLEKEELELKKLNRAFLVIGCIVLAELIYYLLTNVRSTSDKRANPRRILA